MAEGKRRVKIRRSKETIPEITPENIQAHLPGLIRTELEKYGLVDVREQLTEIRGVIDAIGIFLQDFKVAIESAHFATTEHRDRAVRHTLAAFVDDLQTISTTVDEIFGPSGLVADYKGRRESTDGPAGKLQAYVDDPSDEDGSSEDAIIENLSDDDIVYQDFGVEPVRRRSGRN